jgi:hypothetical protein
MPVSAFSTHRMLIYLVKVIVQYAALKKCVYFIVGKFCAFIVFII